MNSGWRLPTRRELFSIVDYGAYDPPIDLNYFPNTDVVTNIPLLLDERAGTGSPAHSCSSGRSNSSRA